MKDTRKGFTLVELLAVIVILAIIMIIAIPAVLSTMEQARQKTFSEYVTKVHNAANNFYLKNRSFDETQVGTQLTVTGGTCYVYTLAQIGMTSTGDYTGDAAVCQIGTNTKVLVRLTDKNYHNKSVASAGGWWNFTDNGEVDVKSGLATGSKEFATTTDTMLNAALGQTKTSTLEA
jgi:type IV pilus assembly protein PilA